VLGASGQEPAREKQVIKADCKRAIIGCIYDTSGNRFFASAMFKCGIKYIKPAARMPQAHALRQEAEWLAPAFERAYGIRTCPRSIFNAANDGVSCKRPA